MNQLNLILIYLIRNDIIYTHGILAQLGEHLPYKQRVTGSSPVGPIKSKDLNTDGEVAQLARACGSYPQCRGFKSLLRYFLLPMVRWSRG